MQYRTPEQVAEEVADMWEEHQGDALLRDYYRKAYRNQPLPMEEVRFLRNDPVKDWEELRV